MSVKITTNKNEGIRCKYEGEQNRVIKEQTLAWPEKLKPEA